MTSDFDFREIIQTFLEEAQDTLLNWEKTCLDLEKEYSQSKCDTLFRYAHNLKGSARSVGLDDFGSCIHKVEDIITALRDNSISLNTEIVHILLEAQTLFLLWCKKLEEDYKIHFDQHKELERKIEKIILQYSNNVDICQISKKEKLDQETITKILEYGFFDDVPEVKSQKPISKDLEVKEKTLEINDKNKVIHSENIRVPIHKIDSIMKLISELSISQSMISHSKMTENYKSRTFHNAVHSSTKIIRDLQGCVLSLRMQPLSTLFQRLERTAMDLAREEGKKVNIRLDGDMVELDKSIIEKVIDPFVHIIRNAVDHGVELPELRKQNGKNEIATITIEAYQNISQIVIAVSDDGNGINPNVILKKAKEKELIDQNSILSDQEIYQLILLPGFSTAEKVTNISGRGVGLDVVKQVLTDIGGDLNIESTPGSGSTFRVYLPTNLSIIDVLAVKVDQLCYVIPIQEISEVIDISSLQIDHVTNMECVAMFRKSPIIIKNLFDLLHDKNSYEENALLSMNKLKPAIICENKGNIYGFTIDEILGQQSIVSRRLDKKLEKLKYYCGCTLLPNGEPAMILSLKELILHIEKDKKVASLSTKEEIRL